MKNVEKMVNQLIKRGAMLGTTEDGNYIHCFNSFSTL